MASTTYTSASISTTEKSLITGGTASLPDEQVATISSVQIWLDLTNMAAGDTFEFGVYEAGQAAGTGVLIWPKFQRVGVQVPTFELLPAVIIGHGYDVTAKKIAGTDRTLGVSLRRP